MLTQEQIAEAEERAIKAAEAGDDAGAWAALEPLRDVQGRQRDAALTLLRVVKAGYTSTEKSLAVLSAMETCYRREIEMISMIGDTLEQARETEFLNAPPPEHPLFENVAKTLSARVDHLSADDDEERILEGLATAARLLGRQSDSTTDMAHKRLIELGPENSARYYNYGLFLKTRGRFAEGVSANRKAAELSDEVVDPYEWNLGICATGAGRGDIALDVWKRMNQIIEMGRFDLPEGSYPSCKIRLAERPLAERDAGTDNPGLEETIWIERLSPCHGIIRSVLYQDLGIDYGDVILMDGAPIAYHSYGDEQIPVFPHLATLVRQHYQRFDFAGTQAQARQLTDAGSALPRDATVYVHSEQYQTLCATCWNDPDIDHDEHQKIDKPVVIGRIAAPPSLDPATLLRDLDAVLGATEGCSIYAPDLCAAAGEARRADIERKRFDLLMNN